MSNSKIFPSPSPAWEKIGCERTPISGGVYRRKKGAGKIVRIFGGVPHSSPISTQISSRGEGKRVFKEHFLGGATRRHFFGGEGNNEDVLVGGCLYVISPLQCHIFGNNIDNSYLGKTLNLKKSLNINWRHLFAKMSWPFPCPKIARRFALYPPYARIPSCVRNLVCPCALPLREPASACI